MLHLIYLATKLFLKPLYNYLYITKIQDYCSISSNLFRFLRISRHVYIRKYLFYKEKCFGLYIQNLP